MSEDVQVSDEESAAPRLEGRGAEMLFGAGQSAWLAVVSVGVLIALAVSFVALFIAMNDDDPVAAPAAGSATSITVEASEFAFDPADVSIVADTDVEVTLDNVGAVEHNWTVLESGMTISDESEFEESMAVAEVIADAGSSSSGSVNLPGGSYQVICTIAGHFSAGMEGTLEVGS